MLAKRLEENPILKPKWNHFWEAQAVFNGCPVRTREGISLVYRALSLPYYSSLTGARLSVSSISIVRSRNG
ncbi:MAG TPA: glycosidase, partial [Dehalococcoidia bacterium]